jgi:CVNH domain
MVRNPPIPPSEMQNQPPYATYPSSENNPSGGAPPPRAGLPSEYYGGPNQPAGYGGAPAPPQGYGPPDGGYGGSPAPYGGSPAPYGGTPSQGGYPPAPIYGGGGNSTAPVPPRTESAPAQMTSESGGEGPRGEGGEEADRGLMGALAGGAAGAYAGHKMHHGIIGAVGGAYAGHKLEDAWKHHSQEQKAKHEQELERQRIQQQQAEMQKQQQWEQQQQQQWAHPPYGGPPPPYGAPQGYGGGYGEGYGGAPPAHEMRGNFSMSSEGTTLRHHGGHHYDLVSRCRRVDGHMAESHLPLNDVLGNNDGHFAWSDDGNGNFGASARGVRLVDGGRVLEAELRRVDGSWNWSRVHLDERVGNSDGRLMLV